MCAHAQARAAVLIRLQKVSEPREFARLMWLVEDLAYDDLLKGTGWGRRRGWFREQLEATATLSQVREALYLAGHHFSVWRGLMMGIEEAICSGNLPACTRSGAAVAAGRGRMSTLSVDIRNWH
jgi:hypothetical protein